MASRSWKAATLIALVTPPSWPAAVIVGIGLVLLDLLVFVMARALARGDVARQGLIGIRIPSLMRSARTRTVGHRAGGPALMTGAVVSAVAAAVSVAVSRVVPLYLVTLTVAVLALLLGVLIGTVRAHRAAGSVTV